MKKSLVRVTGCALIFAALPLAAGTAIAAADSDKQLLEQARQIFQPLPKDMATAEFPITPAKVALGRTLFFEPRVSLDGTVSCAKCHQPALYGTDALPKGIGVKDRTGPRHVPTVFNAALQISAHWRGDRTNVEDQAKQALIGPPSFGQPDYAKAMAALEALPDYKALFQKAFPGDPNPITPDNWAKAIGAYERTLVTPSPFDAYLKGNAKALSAAARNGLRTFIATGCVACHSGVGVGGGKYAKFGVTQEYWGATGSKDVDKGRFDVTKDPGDMYVFKVPSLRNVAMTPPYFHDGSVATLAEAVRVMAKVQLGKTPPDDEVSQIIAFLESLTGAVPKDFATAPILAPASFAAGK